MSILINNSQNNKRIENVVLIIKYLRDDTTKEIEAFNKEIIHIEGSFYVQICDIKKVLFVVDGQQKNRIEVYVTVFEKKTDGAWNIIFKGWISHWPYGRAFNQEAIFQAVDVVLSVRES